jgi:uncharacterized Fe-S center protein
MSKARVYFIKIDTDYSPAQISQSLQNLLEVSKVLEQSIAKSSRVAVKMHFGDEGNTGYVLPQYVKIILDYLKQLKVKAFLTDSNTLYKGKRSDSKSHLKLAGEHGFKKEKLNTPIKIDDETKSGAVVEVKINGEFIKKAKIIKSIFEADCLVGIAHFKGHIMTGFGGAIKNIGMGAASRQGKLEQHSTVSPVVYEDACIACAKCLAVCPVGAIFMQGNKAQIKDNICIGCATCIGVCEKKAIDVNWQQGAHIIQQKMAEYAQAALMNKKKNSAFINFAIKITKECDCLAKDDPRVCEDVGIFTSFDPVAIDKACLDLINKYSKSDLFRVLHPDRDYSIQLIHAEKIGLGTLDYELIKV